MAHFNMSNSVNTGIAIYQKLNEILTNGQTYEFFRFNFIIKTNISQDKKVPDPLLVLLNHHLGNKICLVNKG